MSQIYKITNLINKKIYVGKSFVPDENYYGSGLQIIAAIEKYGKENFSKEILEECSADILDQQEIFWIEQLDARNPLIGYNISIGGTGGNHYWKSLDEAGKVKLREKISKSRTGQKTDYSEERRQNVKAGLKKFWEVKKGDSQWLKERRSLTVKKYILVKDKSIIKVTGLEEFCEYNNLDIGWMTQLSTGKKFKPLNGYYCINDTNQTNEEIVLEIDSIRDKDRKIHEAWLKKTRSRPRYECIYCKKRVTKSNLTRWHNDRCKNNGNM